MITIYSKNGCPHCVIAKTALTEHGYSYEEIRIDENPAAREFLKEAGHRTVPQLYVNGQLLVEGGAAGLRKMTTKEIALRIREINGN